MEIDLFKIIYLIPKNIKFYIKIGGGKYTLIEKKEEKEICIKCGALLENKDYIFRRRAPNVRTYVCSKCGYFEIYIEE
ncbi:MAG: hypothetical protein ACFE9X_13935 [Promethearchaeota archaeon]